MFFKCLKNLSFRWDTAGQERFKSIAQSYYRGANGLYKLHTILLKLYMNHLIMF